MIILKSQNHKADMHMQCKQRNLCSCFGDCLIAYQFRLLHETQGSVHNSNEKNFKTLVKYRREGQKIGPRKVAFITSSCPHNSFWLDLAGVDHLI